MSDTELRGRGVTAVVARAVIWLALVISIWVGVTSLVFGAVSIATSAVTGQIAIQLATDQALPTGADDGAATLVSGNWETASVVVENLDTTTIVLAIIGDAFGVLTQVAIAAAIAMLCRSLLRAAPFRRSLSRTIGASGAVVLIGGMVTLGVSVLAAWMTAEQLNDPADGLDGFWPIMAESDPTVIAIGFALLLTGLAFEYGEHLQRETQGLV